MATTTLDLLRADKQDGIKRAEQILKDHGCEIHGMYIALPDEGVKTNKLTSAAFIILMEDNAYRTCDLKPAEV